MPRGSIGFVVPGEVQIVDGGAMVSTSNKATLMLTDADTHENSVVSLWQHDAAALLGIHYIAWRGVTENCAGIVLNTLNGATNGTGTAATPAKAAPR
ncbi:hypothetical protein QF000_006975 [Paraburkholderia atlantica]|uniref:hypothetical protein n=1 Tax=Paraburkholderia atlantica TaxID=2654982 RepID=UPI003D205CB2